MSETKNDERGASGEVVRTPMGIRMEPHGRWATPYGWRSDAPWFCHFPDGGVAARVFSEADAVLWVVEGVLP